MKRFFFFLAVVCAYVPANAQVQCPAGSVNSNVNLVVNGDFEQGNTGFSSGYSYTNIAGDLYAEGRYAVGASAVYYHPNFSTQAVDHTTGTGQYLIVNGATNPGVQVWCQTVAVQPNTLYLFSTWVTSVTANNPAALQFSINGAPLGSVFSAPAFPIFGNLWPGWVAFQTSWYSDTNTVASICVLNQETNTGGNDFGLDDISFQPCTCTFQTQPVAPASVCSGAPATLSAAAGAGSYNWSPAAGLSCSTCQTITVAPLTNTTYTLVATLNFCKDTVTADVSISPAPAPNAGNDTSVCADQPVTLHASGGTSYVWTPSSGLSQTDVSNPVATLTQSTTYIVAASNGTCTASDTIVVTVANPGGATAGNDTSVCNGNAVNLHAAGAAAYAWLPSNGVSCSSCSNTTATPSATTTYTVITSSNGCVDTLPVLVTVWTLPTADAGTDTTLCLNQTVALDGSGGVSYHWNPGTDLNNANAANPVATALQNTTYTLTVTDANGCTDNDDVSINVNQLPTALVGPDVNVCQGHTADITADGGVAYAWSPTNGLNASTGNAVTATVDNDITYTVTVTDENGCTDNAQVTLSAVLPQTLAVTQDTLICYGSPFVLSVSNGVHYNWSGPDASCNDCGDLSVSFAESNGTYHVDAVDSNGCETSADVHVLINNNCEQLDFPNAFSPNGDNLNDFFRPVSESITSIHFYVYNRWGQRVYDGTEKDKGWDGTFNGKEQPVGSYSWFSDAVSVSGKKLNPQGSVTLVR